MDNTGENIVMESNPVMVHNRQPPDAKAKQRVGIGDMTPINPQYGSYPKTTINCAKDNTGPTFVSECSGAQQTPNGLLSTGQRADNLKLDKVQNRQTSAAQPIQLPMGGNGGAGAPRKSSASTTSSSYFQGSISRSYSNNSGDEETEPYESSSPGSIFSSSMSPRSAYGYPTGANIYSRKSPGFIVRATPEGGPSDLPPSGQRPKVITSTNVKNNVSFGKSAPTDAQEGHKPILQSLSLGEGGEHPQQQKYHDKHSPIHTHSPGDGCSGGRRSSLLASIRRPSGFKASLSNVARAVLSHSPSSHAADSIGINSGNIGSGRRKDSSDMEVGSLPISKPPMLYSRSGPESGAESGGDISEADSPGSGNTPHGVVGRIMEHFPFRPRSISDSKKVNGNGVGRRHSTTAAPTQAIPTCAANIYHRHADTIDSIDETSVMDYSNNGRDMPDGASAVVGSAPGRGRGGPSLFIDTKLANRNKRQRYGSLSDAGPSRNNSNSNGSSGYESRSPLTNVMLQLLAAQREKTKANGGRRQRSISTNCAVRRYI